MRHRQARALQLLNFEGEIAIILVMTPRDISREEAGNYMAGYSVSNDYGLHGFRDTDSGSMLRVKGSDTLCPVGPALVTDWELCGTRSPQRPAIGEFVFESGVAGLVGQLLDTSAVRFYFDHTLVKERTQLSGPQPKCRRL